MQQEDIALDVEIEDILQHLLSTAFVGTRVTFLKHELFEGGKARFAAFNLSTDARVPTAISILDELIDEPFFADLSSDAKTPSECVHSTDVGME